MDKRDEGPVLDPEIIASLRELDLEDGSNLFLELVDIFVTDARAQIGTLQAALSAGDTSKLERAAHTLKSSCANIGALHMSRLCFELEKLGRVGSLEGAPSLVQAAEQAFQKVKSALSEVRR